VSRRWAGDHADLSEAHLTIQSPRRNIRLYKTNATCHDLCLVVQVTVDSTTVVICGDASTDELDKAAVYQRLPRGVILRTSHHGSDKANSMPFWSAVAPVQTIDSCSSPYPLDLLTSDDLALFKNAYSHRTWLGSLVLDLK
jgi:beta-lactamase superfamily II metal-dependent hydrolase